MKIVIRIVCYCIGLLFLAFGVAFSVNSNLGVSPVNSLPFVVAMITKIDLGTCIIGIFSIYILIQIVIKRRDFKWINLTQIVFSTLFGYFVDFAKGMLGSFCFPTYFGQLAMLAISIMLVAVGIAVYLGARLTPMPMEGMTTAIKECFPKLEFHKVKIIVDCTSVLIGVALSFLFMKGLYGIREGTVLSAIMVGRLLPIANKKVEPIMKKLCEPLPEM